MAGAKGWQDIEDYGNGHLKWFQKKGLPKAGIPVHGTIARVIACIEPRQFQQCRLDADCESTH
ncbi:transposase family protein [Xenorhabdus bovienii]|nr:transposase family protein [Xenorhabdus bovienii]MDE9433722.1 transposase family protein [Xenorhabdus bovienii]MDE9443083.1 transposase family protein [Xenorhabdus bovienii]MDE9491348.1 transposase family protein [Xenorhabdus bovienii]MDE9507699.1 transposase family protein [Xenorhabdus bovienii]